MSSGGSSSRAAAPAAPTVVPPTYTSGAAGSQSNTTQTFTPWGQVAPAYDQLAYQTNYMAAQAPQYVGPSAPTQQALGSLYGGIAQGQGALNTAAGNYNTLSNAADIRNNPAVQGMLASNAQQVNQQLREQWLPALNAQAIASGSGAMGSSRAGLAQGQAIGNAAQQLANANAGTLGTAYSQGLQAQQGALGQLGAMQSAYMQPAGALQAAGGLLEGYEQNRINAPWQQIQNIGAGLQYTNPLGTLAGAGTGREISNSSPQGTYDPFTMAPTVASPAAATSMGELNVDAQNTLQNSFWDKYLANRNYSTWTRE